MAHCSSRPRVFETWLDENTLMLAGSNGQTVEDFRQNLVVVAPDVGASKIARAYAKRFKAGLALIDKRRPEANVAEVMNIIGDVKGKNCLVIDDLCDTAGTLTSGAKALSDAGAHVFCYMNHEGVPHHPPPPHRKGVCFLCYA